MLPHLFREKPGILAEKACWVILHDEFIYIDGRLCGVLWQFLTEYKNDKHLIG